MTGAEQLSLGTLRSGRSSGKPIPQSPGAPIHPGLELALLQGRCFSLKDAEIGCAEDSGGVCGAFFLGLEWQTGCQSWGSEQRMARELPGKGAAA